MLELPRAILFDMDDTILTHSHSAAHHWQLVCSRFEQRIIDRDLNVLLNAIKTSAARYWGDPEQHRIGRLNLKMARQQIVTAALQSVDIKDASLAQDMAEEYATLRENTIAPFPDAIQTLQELRLKAVQLALITNGNAISQRRKIDKHQLASFFDCILIEGECGIGKPDQRIYLQALDQLRVKPEDTWIVGDNLEWEVAMPQQLGIFAIWLDSANIGLPKNSPICPDRIIRTLSALLHLS